MSKLGIINFRVGTKALQTNKIKKKKEIQWPDFRVRCDKVQRSDWLLKWKKKFELPRISEAWTLQTTPVEHGFENPKAFFSWATLRVHMA